MDLATCDQLRPHIKWAISEGACIAASGDGRVEWTNGNRANVYICPGGYIISFNAKMIVVCTEEQLGCVLLVIDRELTRQSDA